MTRHRWNRLTLAEVGEGGRFSDGDWVESKDQDPAGSVRLTQLADVGIGQFRDRSNRWLREDQARRLACTFLEPDDVLIARMPDPLGRACLVPHFLGRAVTAVDVAILRVRRRDVDPRFVMWAINSPRFHEAMVARQSGTTRKRISRKNLASLTILVPPVGEQRRIVDILEDHLSCLDAAAEWLRQVRKRALALHSSVIVSALDQARGQRMTLDQLVVSVRNGIFVSRASAQPSGVPILRIGAVRPLTLDLSDLRYSARSEADLRGDGVLVEAGHLLFTRYNGNARYVGACAVVPEEAGPLTYPDKLIRVIPSPAVVLSDFLALACSVGQGRAEIQSRVKTTAGQSGISGTDLRRVELRIPAIDVQRQVVRHVNNHRESIGRLDREGEQLHNRAQSLRRALLEAAFAGRLTGSARDEEVIEERSEA